MHVERGEFCPKWRVSRKITETEIEILGGELLNMQGC